MDYVRKSRKFVRDAADVTHAATQVVVGKKDSIAKGVTSGTAKAGALVKVTGKLLAKVGKDSGQAMSARAVKSDNAFGKLGGIAAGLLGTTAELVGKGLEGVGHATEKSAPVVGALTGGAAGGGAAMLSQVVDSVAISRGDLESMRAELATYGEAVRAESKRTARKIESARRRRRKGEMLDALVVGGVTLSAIVDYPAAVPPEVEEAFELTYPGLAASGETFADVVDRMSAADLPGLVSGVKGKLFELELADHLTENVLPEGMTAEVAGSATQAGWDLQIVDASGQVVDVLQAKATESVRYVLDAMERYPAIDVTSTEEVYAQLVALGAAEGVTNSGISEAVLEAQVLDAANGGGVGLDDLVPSMLGLAIIGLSIFMDKELSWTERGEQFGERGVQAGLAGGAAKAAMVVTQAWWIALLAGVGSRVLASKGRSHREQYEALKTALGVLRERYPALAPPRPLALGYDGA